MLDDPVSRRDSHLSAGDQYQEKGEPSCSYPWQKTTFAFGCSACHLMSPSSRDVGGVQARMDVSQMRQSQLIDRL